MLHSTACTQVSGRLSRGTEYKQGQEFAPGLKEQKRRGTNTDLVPGPLSMLSSHLKLATLQGRILMPLLTNGETE